jgi:hypothetical protein
MTLVQLQAKKYTGTSVAPKPVPVAAPFSTPHRLAAAQWHYPGLAHTLTGHRPILSTLKRLDPALSGYTSSTLLLADGFPRGYAVRRNYMCLHVFRNKQCGS